MFGQILVGCHRMAQQYVSSPNPGANSGEAARTIFFINIEDANLVLPILKGFPRILGNISNGIIQCLNSLHFFTP